MSERSNIITGVYQIRNIINGKKYIGSTSYSISKRWTLHRQMLKSDKHHSIILQRAWNKYGEQNFKFEILEECIPEKCLIREQFYIDNYRPEYNIDPTAGSPRGRKYSDEYKSKLRIRNLGKNNPFFGNHHSEEVRKLISEHRIGKGTWVCGEKNSMFERTHTDENKKKMSIASRKYWDSPEGIATRKRKSYDMCGKSNKNVRRGREHPKYNFTQYIFINEKTNQRFVGTVNDFKKMFNICSEIYNLIKGKYKQYKGWVVTI